MNIYGFDEESEKRLSIKMYYNNRRPKDKYELAEYLYKVHMLYKAKEYV